MNALVRVCEILGSTYCSAGLCFGMHCVGSTVIADKPAEFQIENYLIPITERKHITRLSLSEAGTGSHFYIPETGLTTDGANFLLNDEKTFVTNGGQKQANLLHDFLDTNSVEAIKNHISNRPTSKIFKILSEQWYFELHFAEITNESSENYEILLISEVTERKLENQRIRNILDSLPQMAY